MTQALCVLYSLPVLPTWLSHRLAIFGLPLVGSLLLSACGAEPAVRLEPRLVAVHNTLTALGMPQTGSIHRGQVDTNESDRVDVELEAARCYSFVAVSDDSLEDVSLSLRDPAGDVVARDRTHDGQAAMHHCPGVDGEYELIVRAEEGNGHYVVSAWSTESERASGGCGAPLPIEVGESVEGSTYGAEPTLSGSCSPGAAPDQIYRFTLESPARIIATIHTEYDGVLHLRRACDDDTSEVACNDDAGGTEKSEVSADLPSGTYFLIVDGYASSSGNFRLDLAAVSQEQIAERCAGASPAPLGQPVAREATADNHFSGSCGAAQWNERVHHFDVLERSRVRVSLTDTSEGLVYLRSTCEDGDTERFCGASGTSAVLDPGTYYLFSESPTPHGISLEQVSVEGSGSPGDTCASAVALTPGSEAEYDRFYASNQGQASCGGAQGPELYYSIEVEHVSSLTASVRDSSSSPSLALFQGCGGAEVACAPALRNTLTTIVEPGTYILAVDGDQGGLGRGAVRVSLRDLEGARREAQAASSLRSGRAVNGTTSGQGDEFSTTCGEPGDDIVRELVLRERSRVRMMLDGAGQGSLYLLRGATDANPVACAERIGESTTVALSATLDEGTYLVIVDGSPGEFRLDTVVQAAD